MNPTDAADPGAACGKYGAGDDAALSDVTAGRVIDCDTVVRWLGGWPMAQAVPRDDTASVVTCDRTAAVACGENATTVVWADTAVNACYRIRASLSVYRCHGDTRVAAALVATMVRLIVEGAGTAPGFVDVPLRASLALRVLVERERVVVLGLHWRGSVV